MESEILFAFPRLLSNVGLWFVVMVKKISAASHRSLIWQGIAYSYRSAIFSREYREYRANILYPTRGSR